VKNLLVLNHKEECADEHQKLNQELPHLSLIPVTCASQSPRLHKCVTYQPYESLQCKEDEKADQDVIKGFHLVQSDIKFSVNYMPKSGKKPNVRKRIMTKLKKLKTPASKSKWHPSALAAAIERSMQYNARAWKRVTAKKN
jgi:hypothetical protein